MPKKHSDSRLSLEVLICLRQVGVLLGVALLLVACEKQSRAPDLVTKDWHHVLQTYCSEDINVA